jgi:hypothetical protein
LGLRAGHVPRAAPVAIIMSPLSGFMGMVFKCMQRWLSAVEAHPFRGFGNEWWAMHHGFHPWLSYCHPFWGLWVWFSNVCSGG